MKLDKEIAMELAEMIRRNVEYMAGVTVEVNLRRNTVTISSEDHPDDDIFVQGENAVIFIDEAESLWDRAGAVTMRECYLSVARDYTDELWD